MTLETKPKNVDRLSADGCPACGSELGSPPVNACDVCGKLISEGFQPLDAIRSSYRMQRRPLHGVTAPESTVLFSDGRALASNPAWACTVYAMVPYIGVLFIPPALVMGGYFLFKAGRRKEARDAILCITVGSILLVVQLILWWLLYLIPEIGI